MAKGTKMIEYLKKLQIYKFRFIVKCIDEISLPKFAGSTLRGAFGITLKKNICVQRKWQHSCDQCMLKNNCLYSYIFDTKNIEYEKKNIKLVSPPHPFILSIDFNEKPVIYPKNSILEWEFTFFGKKINDSLPYIIFTFEKMGETGIGKNRGKFKINHILMETSKEIKVIYDHKSKKLEHKIVPFDILTDISDQKISELELRFTSPLQIKQKGKSNYQPEFSEIIKNILRRYDVLLNYHQPDKYQKIDHSDIINSSKNINVLDKKFILKKYSRHSGRQKKWISNFGIIGNIKYEGNITSFIPLLKIGSLINIGKSTSFGFGKFEYKTKK